jgi:uncharacterized protein YkwD
MFNHRFYYLLLIIFTFATISFSQKPTGKEMVTTVNLEFEKELIQLINKERSKFKLPNLIFDESLSYAARYHARDMAVDNYFHHHTFDRKNRRLLRVAKTFERIIPFLRNGISAKSENIGAGQVSPQKILLAWMNSPGHRANILDKEAKYIGIGYYFISNSKYEHYWVMDNGI